MCRGRVPGTMVTADGDTLLVAVAVVFMCIDSGGHCYSSCARPGVWCLVSGVWCVLSVADVACNGACLLSRYEPILIITQE